MKKNKIKFSELNFDNLSIKDVEFIFFKYKKTWDIYLSSGGMEDYLKHKYKINT